MKVLITADLHLSEDEPARLEALQWLVRRGSEEGVDAMLIAGDLFDSNRALRALKGELLSSRSEIGVEFPILTVPGNHDSDLSSSSYLGEEFIVLDESSGPVTISANGEDLLVIGLPYQKGRNRAFRDNRTSDVVESENVLFLTHGSLIDSENEYILQGINRQEEENDHLIFRRDFSELNYDCVVLGHWHQASYLKGTGTDFLYPGSPLPISRRELGRKWYWLLEIRDGKEFNFHKRPVASEGSWYYRKKSLFSVPIYGNDLPREFRDLLNRIEKDPRCALIVEVDGFVPKEDELELKGKLEEISSEFENEFHAVQLEWNVSTAGKFNEPFPSRFIEKIEHLDGSDVDLDNILKADESRYAGLFRETIDEEFEEVKKRILKGSLKAILERLD